MISFIEKGFFMIKLEMNYLFTLLALVGTYLEANVNLSGSDYDFIPIYANLDHSLTLSNGVSLKANTRFIVVRVEGDQVLANFSARKGIHLIPIASTNVLELTQSNKESFKDNADGFSRLSEFLKNRIASGESGWKYLVHQDKVKKYKKWIILYADSSHDTTKALIENFDKKYRSLSESESETFFLYIDTAGDQKNLDALANSLQLKIGTLPWYLSKGYAHSLQHLDSELQVPVIVEAKSNNTILNRVISAELIQDYLSLE